MKEVIKNIQNNLVYHGSPFDLEILKGSSIKPWTKEKNGIFVTPCKALACCFIINQDNLLRQLEQKLNGHIVSINFGYNLWNKPIEELRDIETNIEILVNIQEDFKPIKGSAEGFIYTIDIQKYKNKWHMFNKNPNSDVEFILDGDIKYIQKEFIKVNYIIKSDSEQIKRHGPALIFFKDYKPPYTLKQIKQKYPLKIYNKLKNDPIHKWRATTGIELIHQQPTFEEQVRICLNWQQMSKKQQEISDKKSKQLFNGLTNYEHYNCIMMQKYCGKNQTKIKELVKRYNDRDMKGNNLKYIHLSKSGKSLTMVPRIPENAMDCQDKTIKRICFSTSILQASGAIHPGEFMFIHIPKKEPKQIMTTKEIKDKVQDAPNTGQIWILDPIIQTQVIGIVHFKEYPSEETFYLPMWSYNKKLDQTNCTYFYDYDLYLFNKSKMDKTFSTIMEQIIR